MKHGQSTANATEAERAAMLPDPAEAAARGIKIPLALWPTYAALYGIEIAGWHGWGEAFRIKVRKVEDEQCPS